MKNYFGDVIVFESKSLESRLIGIFTGEKYNHSALRVSRHYAKNMTKKNIDYCCLAPPDDIYESYLILEHKDLDSKTRLGMKIWDKYLSEEYSKQSIIKLGLIHLSKRKKDNREISSTNRLNCSSRIALIYNYVDLPVLDDIHWSQIEPNDFVESPYFRIVGEWPR